MLNLSDKELDRMAREAANEYEPGGFRGPEQWNKVQSGLDRELGRVRFNPFRAIRPMPFYYAPAVLLLAGVSYYFIRHSSSGSPPHELAKAMPRQPAQASDESANTKNLPYKLTSTPDQPQGTKQKPGNNSPAATSPEKAGGGARGNRVQDHSGAVSSGNAGTAGRNAGAEHAGGKSLVDHGSGKNAARDHANAKMKAGGVNAETSTANSGTSTIIPGTNPANPGTNTAKNGANTNHGRGNRHNRGANSGNNLTSLNGNRASGSNEESGGANNENAATTKANAGTKELEYSIIRVQVSHAGKPVIDDSGLRGLALAKAGSRPGPITPGKSHPSMRIDRSLQFGLVIAPDFASVNSLAGDRPGSSFGLTLDYQFVNKLYLSTGILFSRKNYTATAQDYHVPYDYYLRNNMHNVDFVKGTFNLIEIPLNVRYDFSVGGNTAFFASGGLSSYLLTGENCNYYYNLFGREEYRGFNYKGSSVHLFSAVNLSIGVETGLSNDLSVLIAPYVKVPTGGLGFGQVDINSMGINFGLKYAPVLRRSRH